MFNASFCRWLIQFKEQIMIDCKFYSEHLPQVPKLNKNNKVGATAIFEGTVRADKINNKNVVGIEFTTQETIANHIASEMLQKYAKEFDLLDAIIYHRTGYVKAGEICFKVVVNAGHRKEAFKALPQIVDDFKATVPVFGKEILEDNSYEWKQNN